MILIYIMQQQANRKKRRMAKISRMLSGEVYLSGRQIANLCEEYRLLEQQVRLLEKKTQVRKVLKKARSELFRGGKR